MPNPPSDREVPAVRKPRWLQGVGFTVGLGLFIAAVVFVWGQQEAVTSALAAAPRPPLLAVAALVASIFANVSLTAMLIRRLLRPHGTVGRLEMHAVIAAVGLVNYVPLRPGLFGRIAYHQLVNDIPAAATVRVIIQTVALSCLVAAYLTLAVIACAVGDWPVWLGILPPIAVVAAVWAVRPGSIWAPAVLLRYLDALVWALRYDLAFRIIGSPIEPGAAVAFACVSMIATLVPFVSNGLGLREWAIGLLAPAITAHQLELGVTAELVNRAAEVIGLTVLGTAGMAWLTHQLRRGKVGGAADPPATR